MVARSVGQPLPIIPDLHTEIHSYTNVNFALEAAQGRPLTSRGGAVGSSNQPHAARYAFLTFMYMYMHNKSQS